ncbi:MAG: ABC transporter permease [Nitrososphaeria archaeon]|nr:ABC transporter permease [Nitrososphaeria archaeon]MDW8022019.1 ABC transporter permease [Nitrososphaerota archaeon]
MKKNAYASRLTTQILLRPEATLVFAVIALSSYFTAMTPLFASPSNFQNIARWIGTYSFMGLGEMFVLLSGGIDLSIGSVVAFSGLVLAYLMEILEVNWIAAILFTLLMAAGIGAFHGFFVSRFSPPLPQIVPAFLITLITQLALRGVAQFCTKGYPIVLTKAQFQEFIFIGNGNILEIPVPLLLTLTVLAFSFLMLNLSVVGRHIYAVGGNLEAAIVTGLKVNKVRVLCYMLSSIFAAMTGIIITARLSSAYPGVGTGYELQAIAACVLGGVSLIGGEGLPFGVILGVSLMTVIENGLVVMNVSPYLHLIIIGILLAIAVAVDFAKRYRVTRR